MITSRAEQCIIRKSHPLWGVIDEMCFKGMQTDVRVREQVGLLVMSRGAVSQSSYRSMEQGVVMNKTEELIGIFGALCDYMVDNGRCDVFCPYAETKDKDDECEAWRTIQKIRQEE